MGPGSFDPGNIHRGIPDEGRELASMGPGSFDPGNVEAHALPLRPCPRFNGAGVFRPRKFARRCIKRGLPLVLQWGRGLSTPEMLSLRTTLRSCRRLQWGRGLSTPEMFNAVRVLTVAE